MIEDLNITERTPGGKKEARKLRHNGLVPGIVYGAGMEPISVSMDEKALKRVCFSSSFFGHVINIKLRGKAEKILPRDIDFHPVTDIPIHVDFQRVSEDSKVKIHVSIEFINEDKSIGIKKGGVLNLVVHQLECLCPADNIPEKFVLDLSGKDIGDSFGIDDIKFPSGVTPAHPERDSIIATLVGSRISVEEEEEKEASAEEPTTEEQEK
ncbi:MAG: 50S ribosomal protein L25/general stress protein Ctc [Holosporales bacterium]|jgi:large subunit ribosomal protein L25|nr:50S ribosomal protein L25/general stress protein Ctc [Holosporales bacterium]